jgi:hypothetical protein
MSPQRYAKTDTGREEIKNRTRKLSRPARNLLLIVDATRSITDWLHLGHGSTETDLKQLLSEGLIEVKQAVAVIPTAPARSIEQAIGTLSYDQLYGLMTSQARDRLGLIRGYKLILDIEKCSGPEELRKLAVQFLKMVETHQGQDEARQMRRALGFAA